MRVRDDVLVRVLNQEGMSIKMRNFVLESGERLLERDGIVHVQVLAPSREDFVLFFAEHDSQIATVSIFNRLALVIEDKLLAVPLARFDGDLDGLGDPLPLQLGTFVANLLRELLDHVGSDAFLYKLLPAVAITCILALHFNEFNFVSENVMLLPGVQVLERHRELE